MAEVAKVLSQTRKGGAETLVVLNDPKQTKVWRPTASLGGGGGGGGGQAAQATAPAPSITGQLDILAGQRSETAQFLPQFTQAIQAATHEAGINRQADLIGAGLGAVGGEALAPGTAGGIVNMIKSQVGPAVEQVFGGAVAAVSKQIDAEEAERKMQLAILQFKQEIQNDNFTRLSELASSGAMIDTPNTVLQGMAEQAGLDPNVALAWKARASETAKLDKEQQLLENEKLRADIDYTKAQTLKAGRTGGSGASDAKDLAEQNATLSLLDGFISEGINSGLSPQEVLERANEYARGKLGVELDVQTQQAILDRARGVTPATTQPTTETTPASGTSQVLRKLGSGATGVGEVIVSGQVNPIRTVGQAAYSTGSTVTSFFNRLFEF